MYGVPEEFCDLIFEDTHASKVLFSPIKQIFEILTSSRNITQLHKKNGISRN